MVEDADADVHRYAAFVHFEFSTGIRSAKHEGPLS